MATPTKISSETPETNVLKSFAEFLQFSPPAVAEELADVCETEDVSTYKHRVFAKPDIQLHCPDEHCQGIRFFRCTSSRIHLNDKGWKFDYLTFNCRNCGKTSKPFALAVKPKDNHSTVGSAYKFGELPPFGPPTPARVVTLIGPDREVYLSGRRAENHGLGIGAFAYYRRVVENQKGRIIREMGRVAKKLGASSNIVQQFEAAASETQFSTAIERIKDAIPPSLLINGNNPLVLLHKALSEGLHDEQVDDAVCLELAHSIRIVLTELAERMSQVLKDQAELNEAVNRLLNRKQNKESSTEAETGTDLGAIS
jgi:hypothetical protein